MVFGETISVSVYFQAYKNMKLYIGSLHRDTKLIEVKDLFAPFGEIENITIIDDQITGLNHRYGLVNLPDESSAISAIEKLDYSELNGVTFRVRRARVAEEDRRKRGRGGGRRRTDPLLK